MGMEVVAGWEEEMGMAMAASVVGDTCIERLQHAARGGVSHSLPGQSTAQRYRAMHAA